MNRCIACILCLLCTAHTCSARLKKQPKQLNVCWGCSLTPEQKNELTLLIAAYNKALRDYYWWIETETNQKFMHVAPKVNQHYLHNCQNKVDRSLNQLECFYKKIGIQGPEIATLRKQLTESQKTLCTDLKILALTRQD